MNSFDILSWFLKSITESLKNSLSIYILFHLIQSTYIRQFSKLDKNNLSKIRFLEQNTLFIISKHYPRYIDHHEIIRQIHVFVEVEYIYKTIEY